MGRVILISSGKGGTGKTMFTVNMGTVLAEMTNNATGSGMGTAGFVGQIMTWQTMTVSEDPVVVLVKILLLHFVLPGLLSFVISEKMRKMGLIKPGHMKLDM